ncbi:MAG: sulfur carrier protein ThiS [Acidimicrobiales bacterium]
MNVAVVVTLNGLATTLRPGTTVETMVDDMGQGRGGIAVARNSEIIPRSCWAVTILSNGDRVEILAAAQGG